jgi:hypothetical protein
MITLTREEAQQVLDALELVTDLTNHDDELYEAIETLRARLAQPEPEAIYGYCPECGAKGTKRERRIDGNDMCANGHIYFSKKAVYPAPPQREWQGLTDEEIRQLEIMEDEEEERKGWCDPKLLIAWTQALLKEKNT